MKLLLDANISYRLVKKLANICPDCQHVTRIGLENPVPDKAIWQWAKSANAVIVTNDEDYYHFANIYGFPPKVVLLRIGNQSTEIINEILRAHFVAITELAVSTEIGLLEIY